VQFSPLLAVPSLLALTLSSDDLGDADAQQLARGLETNCTLEGLFLRHNRIACEGAAALAASLALNSGSPLSALDLGFNRVADAGALALQQCMQAHAGLTSVNLEENLVSRAMLVALGKGYAQPTNRYFRVKSKDFSGGD
jgi:Ran GTPase-activating protein (RanGAP) involved in mRNA processing and transport